MVDDAHPFERLFDGRNEPPGYVGLTTAAATRRAEAEGHPTRVIDALSGGGITMDYRPARLSLLVSAGLVRRAAFF